VSYGAPSPTDIARRRAELAPFDGWNERAFAQLVAWQGVPESYLDVGSGTGAMVNMAHKMGIDARGVDLINGPEHWFVTHDLTTPLDLKLTVALMTCVEVAEHLPADAAPVLIASLARHLRTGGRIVFSAAPPGQAGEHHINCQPASYWRSLFAAYGISYREDDTRQLSHLFGYVTGPSSHWLAANVQVFDR